MTMRLARRNTSITDCHGRGMGEDLNWFFNQWFLASGHPF